MARLGPAPRTSRHLPDLLKGPLRRAQIAAVQPEVRVDHPDQRQVGEVIALGDKLRADDDVDVARLHPPDELGRLGGDHIVSEVTTAIFASGNKAVASSAIRSTPGPQATKVSSPSHSGQARGVGRTWPQ